MSLQILEDKLVFLIVSQNSDTPHTCVSALCEIPQSLLCKISHYTTIPDVLVFFEDILIKVNYLDNGCCVSVVIKLQYTIRKRCSNRKAPRNIRMNLQVVYEENCLSVLDNITQISDNPALQASNKT